MTKITKTENELRGTGRTSKQMVAAPQGAYFIVPGTITTYHTELAKSLGREDLQVRSITALSDRNAPHIMASDRALILDHAAQLTPEQKRNWGTMSVGDRIVTNKVPNLVHEEIDKLDAQTIAWTIMGTGLIIRDSHMRVLGRLKFSPPPDQYSPEHRDEYMALMQRLEDLINQKNSTTEEMLTVHGGSKEVPKEEPAKAEA